MPDLTAFLLARIAEDKATAESAAEDEHLLRSLRPIASSAPLPGGEILHIVRWDPARVLAECEAKRRIIERLTPDPTGVRDSAPGFQEQLNSYPILRLLALPYADHPDFNESWRVE